MYNEAPAPADTVLCRNKEDKQIKDCGMTLSLVRENRKLII